MDTQLNQLSRKVADFKNLAQKSRESFLESCKEFGIAEAIPEGEVHLTSEYLKHLLQQSSKENLSILVDIEKKLKNPSIGDMINFYEGFTQFTFQFQDVGEPPCSNQDFCPTLREFGRSDTICTQIDAEVENVGSDTEWDIQIVESGAQNPESGFDGETYEELPETLTEFEGNDHETLAKDSSKVNSALSLMLIENRTRITLELNEILSFIKSRIQELEVSNGDMSYLVLIDTSFVRHDINKGLITLSGWVAIIEDILAQLKSHSLVNSLRIQSSSFFLDQISRSLVSKYELEFRYRTKMRQISNQRGELALSRETLCSNLDLLKRNLKTLRDFIEHQTLSLFPGQLQEFHLYGDLDLLFLH